MQNNLARANTNRDAFNLIRYFSITSFIGFIVVTIILAQFYRQTAIDNLITLRESNNIALTQVFANSIWPEFESFVNQASELTVEEIRNHPETARLLDVIQMDLEGLSVVKVKIYDMEALTVFSTEAAQIGDDKSDNAGYQMAATGGVATELTHRDTFSAFEQTIEDRDVISSYIPIQRNGSIEGVFEVYDDVTPLLQRIEGTQRTIVVGVTLILAVLYLFLFAIVRRGHWIISELHNNLEKRVAERTRELLLANKHLEAEIAGRSRVQSELAIARDHAVEALCLKSQILANVSHDARTPLSIILLYTELLLGEKYGVISVKGKEKLGQIILQTKQLTAFVENLLDAAQQDANTIILEPVEFSPEELLEDIRTIALPLAEMKSLSVRTNLDNTVPPTLFDDTKRLKHILHNLVDNAIKFTDKGSISIRFYSDNPETWCIEVSDTGKGIPEEAQSEIFKAFWQMDGSSTRRTNRGVGLGLSIVRHSIDLLNGQIEVESTPDRGATFIVTLPVKLPAPVQDENLPPVPA